MYSARLRIPEKGDCVLELKKHPQRLKMALEERTFGLSKVSYWCLKPLTIKNILEKSKQLTFALFG